MYKVLIIGLGNIGMGYDFELDKAYVLTHVRAFALHNNFEITGVVEKEKTKIIEFKKKYNSPCFNNIDDALQSIDADVYVVATPSSSHADIINKVLDTKKPKFILCEKPLDSNFSKSKQIINRCLESEIPLFVNYIRRSNKGSNNVRNMITNQDIATPLKGNVWYTKGLVNNCSHFLNLLESWLGKVIGIDSIKIERNLDIVDYDADFRLNFEKGSILFQSAKEESQTFNSIELIASNGRLLYENGGESISWQAVEKDKLLKNAFKISNKKLMIQDNIDQYQMEVVNEIFNFLNNRPFELCSAREALATIDVLSNIISIGKKNYG